MGGFIDYQQQENVVILTMNQPEALNALSSSEDVLDFLSVLAEVGGDTSIRALVLTGGGKAFSAGGNIKRMREWLDEPVGGAAEAMSRRYREGVQRLAQTLYGLEVPTIAAVNGPAYGAGLDLACMCDIRIASTAASFAESFIKVGLVSGDGGAWFLPKVVGPAKAAEMTFTGEPIDAAEARNCGLVSKVVAPEDLLPAALDLARRIAANPGLALRLNKRLIRRSQELTLEDALELALGFQLLAHKSPEHRDAVLAFVTRDRKKDGGI